MISFIKPWLSSLSLRPHPFHCPICDYQGKFEAIHPPTGRRPHAKCPTCGSLERHRLQQLVLNHLQTERDFVLLRTLHVAPEPFFEGRFRATFKEYTTTDLHRKTVDIQTDITDLPFPDHSFDLVYASHVLEHIKRDDLAIAEIHRILVSGGMAILPVPVVRETTLEYDAPNPLESGHVRAPGLDYGDRYRAYFSQVLQFTSEDFPAQYQLYIHEEKPRWKAPKLESIFPRRRRYPDIVPVCIK